MTNKTIIEFELKSRRWRIVDDGKTFSLEWSQTGLPERFQNWRKEQEFEHGCGDIAIIKMLSDIHNAVF